MRLRRALKWDSLKYRTCYYPGTASTSSLETLQNPTVLTTRLLLELDVLESTSQSFEGDAGGDLGLANETPVSSLKLESVLLMYCVTTVIARGVLVKM